MQRKCIIKKKSEFNLIFKKGKMSKSTFLIVKTLYPKNNDWRIGISIPKKSFKLAVVRNKIKRQLKNIISSIGFINGDHLIIVKKNYDCKNDFNEFKKDIQKFIKGK